MSVKGTHCIKMHAIQNTLLRCISMHSGIDTWYVLDTTYQEVECRFRNIKIRLHVLGVAGHRQS